MRLGRLEVKAWRDTGKPRFRLWFWRYGQGLYNVPTYLWIFKVLSYWTLWVAWQGPAHTQQNIGSSPR